MKSRVLIEDKVTIGNNSVGNVPLEVWEIEPTISKDLDGIITRFRGKKGSILEMWRNNTDGIRSGIIGYKTSSDDIFRFHNERPNKLFHFNFKLRLVFINKRLTKNINIIFIIPSSLSIMSIMT